MTTLAHEIIKNIANQWETYYASAVFSGIVSDAAHLLRNTYHSSLEDNPNPTGFSCNRPDDAAPPGDWPRNLAAAIDMSMNTADMTLCSSRLWNVWNDTSDPRRVYINAFNGWFGSGDAKRYDFVTQSISVSTSDHKWHVHLEERRRWVTSIVAADAILSILRGETKQQYLDSLGGYVGMYAKHGMGLNGSPISHDTLFLQDMMLFVVNNDEGIVDRLPEHPLVVDGKYGDNTAYWVSVIVTGGAGTEVKGNDFSNLVRIVNDKQIGIAMKSHTDNYTHVDITYPVSITGSATLTNIQWGV